MKRFHAFLLLLFCLLRLGAQTYWKETTDTVGQPGYYHIVLSQEIAGRGLENLKLTNPKEEEIPYFIRSSVSVKEITKLHMYGLLSFATKDSTNVLVVDNHEQEEISRFYLLLKEADAIKRVSMKGSNDRQLWFSVKQESLLRSEQNSTWGSIAIIDFPRGNYKYYQITITNNSHSPLDIIGVGKIESNQLYGQFSELNTGNFAAEVNDKKQTVIRFPSMPAPYLLSKLEIKVADKRHYKRTGYLRQKEYTKGSFTLSSREENTSYWDNVWIDKDFRIVIDNQDNPPLEITSVKLFGLTRYMCAYLEPHTTYCITTNNERHKHYDIKGFADEIPVNLPVILTTDTEEVTVSPAIEAPKRFFEKPLFLWSVIIITGLILTFICIKMLNELKKKA